MLSSQEKKKKSFSFLVISISLFLAHVCNPYSLMLPDRHQLMVYCGSYKNGDTDLAQQKD